MPSEWQAFFDALNNVTPFGLVAMVMFLLILFALFMFRAAPFIEKFFDRLAEANEKLTTQIERLNLSTARIHDTEREQTEAIEAVGIGVRGARDDIGALSKKVDDTAKREDVLEATAPILATVKSIETAVLKLSSIEVVLDDVAKQAAEHTRQTEEHNRKSAEEAQTLNDTLTALAAAVADVKSEVRAAVRSIPTTAHLPQPIAGNGKDNNEESKLHDARQE